MLGRFTLRDQGNFLQFTSLFGHFTNTTAATTVAIGKITKLLED
jgi:hypothetical protein